MGNERRRRRRTQLLHHLQIRKRAFQDKKSRGCRAWKGRLDQAEDRVWGAYGNPLDRDPRRVADDVRDEYLTPETAREKYGVVLPIDLGPDQRRTETTRKNR